MRLLIAALALAPLLAAAETAYVTDNLRLGLHQAEDTSDRAFRMLESGQQLEVITRDRNYAQVTLPDGTRGYVKLAYLVFDKPARLIVAETEAERARLEAELEKLRQQFEGPAETIASLEEQVDGLEQQLEESQARAGELAGENEELRGRQQQYKYSLPLSWAGGAIGAALIGGLLLGFWWVDHRSRKRHGGIRIY